MPAKLLLDEVHQMLRDRATEAYEVGDPVGFVCSARSNGVALALVFDNIEALQWRGIYEGALVAAFVGCRINHRAWSVDTLRSLFELGDRAKLLACGTPLPGPGPFLAYRGVCGIGRSRRVGGLSWTGSLDTACWFALRHSLPNPAVFETTLGVSDIYCFTNDRSEEEYICHPKKWRRVRLSSGEMAEGQERVVAKTRAAAIARSKKVPGGGEQVGSS